MANSNEKWVASWGTLDSLAASANMSVSDLGVIETSKGFLFIGGIDSSGNKVVLANLAGNLKGKDSASTAKKLKKVVNFTVGFPEAGAKGQNGQPALPCVMEGGSFEDDWNFNSFMD